MQEVEGTLVTLVGWVIVATPVAVLSLIAQAVGNQEKLAESFSNVGYLVLATVIAFLLHIIVVHFGLLGAVLHENPLKYLRCELVLLFAALVAYQAHSCECSFIFSLPPAACKAAF